jgi:hypothetical protein
MLQKIERTTDYLNALKNGEIFVGKTITLRDAGFRKTRINKILQIITATIGKYIP